MIPVTVYYRFDCDADTPDAVRELLKSGCRTYIDGYLDRLNEYRRWVRFPSDLASVNGHVPNADIQTWLENNILSLINDQHPPGSPFTITATGKTGRDHYEYVNSTRICDHTYNLVYPLGIANIPPDDSADPYPDPQPTSEALSIAKSKDIEGGLKAAAFAAAGLVSPLLLVLEYETID